MVADNGLSNIIIWILYSYAYQNTNRNLNRRLAIMTEKSNNKINVSTPLVSKVLFKNLGAKSKYPAKIELRLANNMHGFVYFMKSSGNKMMLEGFRDPNTGLFITTKNLKRHARYSRKHIDGINQYNELPTSAIHVLMSRLQQYAYHAISEEMKALRAQMAQNPEAFLESYKDIGDIESELYDCVDDPKRFMADIYAQLRNLPPLDLPSLNEFICYSDDPVITAPVTLRLQLKNPIKQELTQEQKDVVEHFLSVFFDQENLSIFSWMMGTVFLNKSISLENISRFFLLYSRNGGVGKSTLVKLITDGLLARDYASETTEFDRYFLLGDRFSSSSLAHNRLVVYDEAVFNGPLDKENMHNFHGLNEDAIKSFATNGHLAVEEKFQPLDMDIFYNIHLILTNFLPVIPANRYDLGRRFLDCRMKPTTMQDKAKQLGGMNVQQMVEYVRKNGQAFINYFADSYKQDPYRFSKYAYQHDVSETESQDAEDANAQKTEKQLQEIHKLNAFDALKELGDQANCDVSSLLTDIVNAKPDGAYLEKAHQTQSVITYTNKKQYPDIHFVFDYDHKQATVYLNSSKSFWMQFNNGLALRESMLKYFTKTKKFTQRVFELPLMKF